MMNDKFETRAHVEVGGQGILFELDLLIAECRAIVANKALLAADALVKSQHTPQDREKYAQDKPADAQSFLNGSTVHKFYCLVNVVVEEGVFRKNRH